jgi:hypothetical protein
MTTGNISRYLRPRRLPNTKDSGPTNDTSWVKNAPSFSLWVRWRLTFSSHKGNLGSLTRRVSQAGRDNPRAPERLLADDLHPRSALALVGGLPASQRCSQHQVVMV